MSELSKVTIASLDMAERAFQRAERAERLLKRIHDDGKTPIWIVLLIDALSSADPISRHES